MNRNVLFSLRNKVFIKHLMDRKRKNISNISKQYKKPRYTDWNDMISASSIRNYMLDDPLLDWLKYYSIKKIDDIPTKLNHNIYITSNTNYYDNNYMEFIMEQGLLFEKVVIDKLKENYTITQISNTNMSHSWDYYMETINMMKKGAEIIYQGVIHDYKNKLYGTPDLLIRSDCFENIFNYPVKNNSAPLLSTPFHYIVVDIKHSLLTFNSKKEYLLNNNSIPAYKGQVYIYNKILSEIQGYMPSSGFLLGKKTIYTKNKKNYISENFMNNIAEINYNTFDKDIIIKINKAIEWIHNMRQNGHNWHLLPTPSIPELYPNMKNTKDSNYHMLKMELADQIYEITNIWWCGYNKRNIAHMSNIYGWNDNRLNATIMNFNDNKIASTVNHILNINRSATKLIRTNDLINTLDKWDNFGDDTLEFYIDFETMNGNIGQIIDEDNINPDVIFMIGLGWEENNEWKYKSFILKENNNEAELEIINNMFLFINNKKQELNKNKTIFIHWTNAEVSFFNKFKSKHLDKTIDDLHFYDLHKLFLENNIVVKGALNFSLKTIANAMYKHNMISTKWDTKSICSNGLQAMYLAYNLYKNNNNIIEEPIMKEIETYNMIDCKVMWEILKYLRNII